MAAEMTPSDLAVCSSAYWAVLNKIKLAGGVFSLQDRHYQLEPMQSVSRRKCYMKATQMGVTEIEVLNTLHGQIHGRYKRGVLYMFPTTDEVNEFGKSRFNPLISANVEAIGRHVKAGGKGTDTSSLKKIGNSFLYLRGARLTQTVGGGFDVKESVKLRGIPVDRCVFDETDLMDESVFAKARGRMGDSDVKEEVYLSNPTAPGYGIDKIFQTSDQRHYFRRCSCGEWVSAEVSFPDCVKIRDDGTGYIGCPKCGGDVGPSSGIEGEWVPSVRENSDYMHGYQLSQLLSVNNDPAEILENYINPPQDNLDDVYRLQLGLPHVSSEDQLSPDVIMECSGNDAMLSGHPGPCAMGVDVGKIKHVVVGIRTGADRYEILKVAQLSEWSDIHDLAAAFNVRSAVIDIRPYEDAARQFQKAEPYRIYLCQYMENSVTGTTYSDVTGIVKADRTEIFDTTHRLFSTKSVRIPRNCPAIAEFTTQCCKTAKILETNKRTGASIYRYKKLGDEHYRNALNYFALAASGSKIAIARPRTGRYRSERRLAIHEYQLV